MSAGERETPEKDPRLEALGLRVREARDRAGLTQQDLADAAGLTRVTINRVEAGQVDVRVTNLVAIARALDSDPGSLIGGLGEVG